MNTVLISVKNPITGDIIDDVEMKLFFNISYDEYNTRLVVTGMSEIFLGGDNNIVERGVILEPEIVPEIPSVVEQE